jgi:hypothetical protein
MCYRLLLALLFSLVTISSHAATWRVVDEQHVGHVPSAFPVNFSLTTRDKWHYVAFYGADRQMIAAQAKVGEHTWQRIVLPTRIRWDSHNYVTLALDKTGHLHLAGNMHNVPLIYFRSTALEDVAALKRFPMTGRDEEACTYPVFLTDADENLYFLYRDGGSGNGSSIVNRYDTGTQTWSRFLDEPLFDGEGQRNSYPLGPVKGADGLFHIVWVWRDTPDCATNHHLSYVRSRDLKNWETAAGTSIELPLRLDQEQAWVDPIPSRGGIINGCQQLFIDSQNRPIISYHKSDADGHMQIYVARFENNKWNVRPITTWDKPVHFEGFGTMPFIGIEISNLKRVDDSHLYIEYRHKNYGTGQIVIDEATLTPVSYPPQIETPYPAELLEPVSDWPGMEVHIVEDAATSPDAKEKFILRWETLPSNQDEPREPPLPPPSPLKLIKLQRVESD